MIAAKLVVIGLSVINLGTIKEADGTVSRSFWVRNEGTEPTTLVQGYTSCGCTTIDYEKDKAIAPGDSSQITLHFNPRGKGGEFYESGTVVYMASSLSAPAAKDKVSSQSEGEGRVRQFTEMALEGICITSEETLLRQHPIKLDNGLRVSVAKYDLGYMSRGEQKERYVSVLFPDMDSTSTSSGQAGSPAPDSLALTKPATQRAWVTQSVKFTFTVDENSGKGLQHVTQSAPVTYNGRQYKIDLTFDVIIR